MPQLPLSLPPEERRSGVASSAMTQLTISTELSPETSFQRPHGYANATGGELSSFGSCSNIVAHVSNETTSLAGRPHFSDKFHRVDHQ